MTTLGWVILWVVLILGSLAVFALLGLHLFRKATALIHQASGTAEVFSAFAQALDAAQTPAFVPAQAIGASAAEKEQWRMLRRINRVKRAQRKARRREVTFARWRELINPARTD